MKWCSICPKKLNISNENTYAIGDSKNDKILLANVGNSICMENGDPEMKKIAKITIGNNNTDSIANYLYTLIENEK